MARVTVSLPVPSRPSASPATSNAPADKLARHRLSVLDLAETLGSVSEACKRSGMTRTMFYEWKRRFTEQGIAGLKDLPPVAKSHPQTSSPETIAKVIEESLARPAWGCIRLEAWLKKQGIRVSSPTIQKILIDHGLASRYDRWLQLERRVAADGIPLSEEQIAFLERENPQFKERHVESSRPGELLCQDNVTIGSLKGIGKLILHTVVDTHGSYAFGFLYPAKVPEAAVAVLHNDVLPFYAEREIKVSAILTDNGREFCGTEAHPYELYLALCDIEHRTTRVRHPETNGFVERFHRTIDEEFVKLVFQTRFFTSMEEVQDAFDAWLIHYNTERPHLGYRNQGRTPQETVDNYCNNRPANSPVAGGA